MRTPGRRFGSLAIVAVVVMALGTWPGGADPGSSPIPAGGTGSRPSLAPEVVAAALDAQGRTVRHEPGVLVERVPVPDEVESAAAAAPDEVWRVTLSGRFPPRALRYVVRADRRPLAVGVPSPNGRAVVAITTDPAVLSAQLTATYGERPSGPASRRDTTQGSTPANIARTGPLADPAAPGPLAVTRAVYDLGDEVFQPSEIGAKVELTGDVHYPTDLSGGPYPLVLFMHGNHGACYQGRRVGYRWPCKTGWKPLPNYEG